LNSIGGNLEEFNASEQKILEPYFSNLDKPVFVLKNMPEVVKGTLFSRYSRSAKPLRRLLLDEFIQNPDMKFEEIAGKLKQHDSKEEIIATKKAEEFYDRVLVDFGDDSVAELGGAHIATEEISDLAHKFLCDRRLGLSPLVKSTRYVYFDQKVDGKYQYYRDPKIMESKYADDFTETCDALFDVYSKNLEPMRNYIMEQFPQQEDVSDRAYKSTVKAKACDTLRPFLPAATKINMGIFGNGRAFEYLIQTLYSNELTEMRELGKSMHTELNKVIPSFVKRANDQYGMQTIKFLQNIREKMSESLNQYLKEGNPNSQPDDVVLIDYDKDPEVKLLSAILYPYSNLPEAEIREQVKQISASEREKILDKYIGERSNRRHKPDRAFENTYYRFDIMIDYGAFRDLQRHRVMTQQRQKLTTVHGYVKPVEYNVLGIMDEYQELMKQVDKLHRNISKEMPYEAQYAVTFGNRMRWYISLNLRELYHLCELRSIAAGHPNYRIIAQKMYSKVKEVHPLLVKHMKFVDMKEYALERLESEKGTDRKIEEVKRKYSN